MNDYRYNPFSDALEPVAITGETHIIPSNSPYTIRLKEVPVKESPSTVSLTISGVAGVEVAADPAAGQFRCDYTTGADEDDNWNTGLIQFNAADAGKTVVVSYNGMGTLASANLHGLQLFTASGTFTVPKGVDEIYITVVGGGGGGGGGNFYGYAGGKGGAASAVYKAKFVVTPGVTFTVTCGNGGNGGNGGTSSGVVGSAGGTSSFGALVSASGGGGGGGALGNSSADGANAAFGNAYPFSLGAAANGANGRTGGAGYAGSTIWYGCGGGGGGGGSPNAGGNGGNGAGGWILVEW